MCYTLSVESNWLIFALCREHFVMYTCLVAVCWVLLYGRARFYITLPVVILVYRILFAFILREAGICHWKHCPRLGVVIRAETSHWLITLWFILISNWKFLSLSLFKQKRETVCFPAVCWVKLLLLFHFDKQILLDSWSDIMKLSRYHIKDHLQLWLIVMKNIDISQIHI